MSEAPEPTEQPDLDSDLGGPGVRTLCPLPEGGVALGVVEVCDYLDEDGDTCYAFRFPGEMSYSHVLGLLELTKAQVIAQYLEHTGGDD